MSSETAAPAAPAPSGPTPRPPRRRRPVRALLIVVVALAVLCCAAVGGIGWYFSGVATEVDHSPEYPISVLDAGNGTVTLPRTPYTERPGTWGLVWKDGGRAVLGPVTGGDTGKVVRTVTAAPRGAPAKGTPVAVDHWVYGGDPRTALGLDFQNVAYPSRLGPMPAWLVPGATMKGTWVIGVHGHNADKAETFRVMRAVHGLGLPMLSIAYRNDVGAPASPDGKNHLGDTEWNEVASAIAYARAHGATGIVLHGWSMGGEMVMTALRKDPALIRGVVLDSPVMDWAATLDMQGADRGLPGFVTGVARRIVQWRIGIDLGDYDQRRFAPRLKTPTLLFTTADDDTVDNGPSLEFAKAAPPGMVTHAPTAGGHTESWNVDPAAYERALTAFLTKVR
ncbi:alpha/beta hydrolase family protein [Actinomadura xylanilytica]|uniref:alpha/beta hydrolase family protein n=1 Tax=Actinomadura xylanilytica TaxID=887459 RepID=UPI00255AA27D|nr:alpha/beta fold hydrolase [Actinomadura xylanilytica]MDL4772153.1 prolyl oligopeptidase family serine peptidase [Actinomadura xylanilytica]